jgi:hypothetical protein
VNSGSASTRALECPILRDNTTNTTGLSSATVAVYAATGKTVSCWLYSRDSDGDSTESVNRSVTGGGSSELTWDSDDITTSWSPGYYMLYCQLTGSGTQIRSYRWTEY